MEKIKVLYIDDEEDNLMAFKSSYRRIFDIYIADSAKKGIDILKNNRIEVIIADQRMPNMTGIDFFESILNTYPNPIRILLTGYSDISDVKDAINKGQVYRYINKPWNEYELKITIENAYQIYHLKEQNNKLQNKYQKVFSESNDAIMLFDIYGNLIDYNKATLDLFELKNTQLKLTLFSDLITNKIESNYILNTLKSKGVIKNYECKLSLNNVEKSCLLSANKINDTYSDENTYQAIIRDVTTKSDLEKLLLKTVINTQESERIRISRDLHDSFGQLLVGIKFQMDSLNIDIKKEQKEQKEQIANISTLISSSIDQLRSICYNISPPSLTDFGLEKSIKQLCKNYSSADFKVIPKFINEVPPLEKELEIALYRITQEFINNSFKHSQCSAVNFSLESNEKFLFIKLRDNGKGFDIDNVNKGLGINNIISRVKSFDGSIDILATNKLGTKFKIYIPLT